tara:strand:+ start:1327 stop:4488 length:3162 start_codon:yes stop_codon:yes gene_type:complete
MSEFSKEEIIAELNRRGSVSEPGLVEVDDQVKNLETYLVENEGFSGQPDYEKVKEAYKVQVQERAKLFSQEQAKQFDKTGVIPKLDAIGRGFNEGAAKMAGLSVDYVSAGLGAIGIPTSDEPFMGSKDLSRDVQRLGMGYYDAVPNRIGPKGPEDETFLPPILDLFRQAKGEPSTLGDMPPSTRPGAVAGEEMAFAASTFAPVGLLARGKKSLDIARLEKSRNPVNQMVAFAAKNPRINASLEGSFAALSALGGAAAEASKPGDETARMVGTIGLPISFPLVAVPAHQILKLASPSVDKIKQSITARLSEERAETAVAKRLQQAVIDGGENPLTIASTIEDFLKKNPEYRNKSTKGSLSPGLATGDETLLAIERSLIQGDQGIGKRAGEQTKEAILEMNSIYNSALNIKNANPELLREVAEKRIADLNTVTGLRVAKQMSKVEQLAKNLRLISGPGSLPVEKQKQSQKIQAIFKQTYDELRDTENALWNKIDPTVTITPRQTEAILLELASEKGIVIPNALLKTGQSLTSGELLKARSEVSKQIRNAMKGKPEEADRNLARQLHQLEDAINSDLSSSGLSPQIRLANNATRNRYEFLSLPPVSQMYTRGIQGYNSKPDLVLDGLLMGNRAQKTFNSFEDLMAAGAKGKVPNQVQDPLAKFYYAMANETVGPLDTVDLSKLSNFLVTHQDGLKKLGIYDGLQDSAVQGHLVKKLESSMKTLRKGYLAESVAGKLLKTNEVNQFIGNSLFTSASRNKDLHGVRKLLRKKTPNVDPVDAEKGIQQSILNNLIHKSTPSGQPMDGDMLLNLLAAKQGKNSLEQDLLDTTLLSARQIDGIKQIAKRAKVFEESLVKRETGKTIKDLPPESDRLLDIIGRLGGAAVMTSSPVVGGVGYGLIVAQLGSRVGRDIVEKLPNAKLRDIMTEAILDPVFMKVLLEKPTSAKAKREINTRIGFILVSKGILTPEEHYMIESPEAQTESLQSLVAGLAKKGNSRLEIMDIFEKKARQPKTTIGPMMLDQVQSILELSNGERSIVMERYEKLNQDYGLKRRRPTRP